MKQVVRDFQAVHNLSFGAVGISVGPLAAPCYRVAAAKGVDDFAGARSGKKLEIRRWLPRHEGWL